MERHSQNKIIDTLAEDKMKLPTIIRATWEKDHYPAARYIVTERRYCTYTACETFGKAIRQWFIYLLQGYN